MARGVVTRRAGVYLFAALVLTAAGGGCELIAGTHARDYDPDASIGAGGAGGAGATSAGSGIQTSSPASSGSGAGSGGGSSVSIWPDSATRYCSDANMKVDCPTPQNAGYRWQDGDYELNVPTYDLVAGKTITDNVTGLVWEGDLNNVSGQDTDFGGAKNHCDDLNNKAFAGQKDWRVPSRRELVTLIDAGRPPYANTSLSPFFPFPLDALLDDASMHGTVLWTNTVVANDKSSAWVYTILPNGNGLYKLKQDMTNNGRAICVRGPSLSSTPKLAPGDKIVQDTTTGLAWQSDVPPDKMNWPAALKYCHDLSLDGMSGFRLPSIKELLSVIDDTNTSVAIESGLFTNTAPDTYWSASPYPGDPKHVWAVNFLDGTANVINIGKDMHHLICVR